MPNSKTIRNFVGLASYLAVAPVISSFQPLNASTQACPTSGTASDLSAYTSRGICYGTPDRYQITIYEMGICTSNPLSGNVFSKDSCTTTMSQSTSANLAGGATVNLPKSSSRPTEGSYPYAYIVINNTFGLKSSYTTTSGGTFYSDSNGNAKTTAPAQNFNEALNDFGQSSFSATYSENVGTGTISALLTDSSLNAATSSGSVSRLVGSFKPSSPIVIDSTSTGLQVTFSVTNTGLSIGTTDNPEEGCMNQVCDFGSGPFRPSFTVF